MDKDLKAKIESLKVEPTKGKKKGPCHSCKQKAAVTKLPDPIDVEDIYVPTPEDILGAYMALNNRDINSVKDKVNKVYTHLFNEEFNFGCGGCANTQARKLKNYINNVLKINI